MREFDSVGALTDYANGPVKRPANITRRAEITRATSGEHTRKLWLGVDGGYQAVNRLVEGGWADGAARVQAFADKLGAQAPTPRCVRRRIRRKDFGDELDIQAVYRGQLDRAWSVAERDQSVGVRNVTILAPMQGNCTAPDTVFFWRGAAVMCLAERLTAAGYNVEIIATYDVHDATDCGRERFRYRATVKRADMPLDGASLAAVLALAGFKRITGFDAVIRLADEIGKDASPVLGTSMPWEVEEGSEEIGGLERAVPDGTPVTGGGIGGESEALAWVTEQLRKLDPELIED